ncbi:MAG: hypothetical protein ACYC35_02460 [Pirellulales bacterium]
MTDPRTKTTARQPHIVVIDEGTKIDMTVAGRQPNGATVDVTVEQTRINKVDIKKCDPGTCLQIPSVATRKRRVIDFVRFGDTLVVPMGEKLANGRTPRVEIFVGAGEIIKFNWPAHAADELLKPADAQREAIFHAILATGAARVSCERASRWAAYRGQTLHEDLAPLRLLSDLATYCPHQDGVPALLCALAAMLDDPARVERLEEALVGCDPGYCVELRDSPSLLKNVELLSRLPSLSCVTIKTKKVDDRLLQAVKKLPVQHLELDATTGNEPAWFTVRETHDGMTGSTDELVKTVSVPLEQAESAIPLLKALPNLEEVLIETVSKQDEAESKRTLTALQQALPNAETHILLFTGDCPENPQTALPNGRIDAIASKTEIPRPNASKSNGEIGVDGYRSLMGMVDPRIIIQEEEEERMGIPTPSGQRCQKSSSPIPPAYCFQDRGSAGWLGEVERCPGSVGASLSRTASARQDRLGRETIRLAPDARQSTPHPLYRGCGGRKPMTAWCRSW